MDYSVKSIALTDVKKTNTARRGHIPSKVQADTLFTFTTSVKYLMDSLEKRMIPPRYCAEDIRYLRIKKIKKIAYPMKCFCDINLHRLEDHLSWYGYYGLAFSKEWGMKHGVQPVQYINPDSEMRKDYTRAFGAALEIEPKTQSSQTKALKDYMLHQLMYYKPYSGTIENRNTHKMQRKCFTDECEWRYVPDVTKEGFCQVFYDESIINAESLRETSNALSDIRSVSLLFTFDDVKYIIVKTMEDFTKLHESISSWNLGQSEEHSLISKILVWDNSKGDF